MPLRRSPRVRPTWCSRLLTAALLSLVVAGPLGLVRPAAGQGTSNPVYVDDSPRAYELFLRAGENVAENTGEAVRLYQQLLDDFGDRLLPVRPDARDHLASVRNEVHDALRSDATLLERYRIVERGEAERLLAAGAIDRLATTRALTTPGLEALLRLTQDALEAARFDAAISHAREAVIHPDCRGASARTAWWMLGVAAHYASARQGVSADAGAWYAELVAQAQAALDANADADRADPALDDSRGTLTALIAAGAGPERSEAWTPLDRNPTADLQQLDTRTLWAVDSTRADAPMLSDFEMRLPGRVSPDTNLLGAAMDATTIYLNDGRWVNALDRFTAQPRWNVPYREGGESPGFQSDDGIGMRLLSVADGDLVTITGHASTERSSIGAAAYVVCLDAVTGERRWRTRFNRLMGRDEFEGLFPHGRPIIADGRVFVLARRVTGERLISCYVVALDRTTGNAEWVQHIASTGTSWPVMKPVTTLVADRSDLLVSTPVGATARLDAATGRIHWLVRTDVPVTVYTAPNRPWELGGPVLVGERLVAIRPDRRAVEVRDRLTGTLEREIPVGEREPWGRPRYLMGDGRRVFAIGRDVRCFDLAIPDTVIWQQPGGKVGGPLSLDPDRALAEAADPDDFVVERVGGTPREGPDVVGHVVMSQFGLMVPTEDALIVYDRETGQEVERFLHPGTGVALGTDEQVVFARPDIVFSAMSPTAARTQLRDRLEAAPRDPKQQRGLLQLAIRIGDLDLVMDAARPAIAALEQLTGQRQASERQALFAMLLGVHDRGLVQTDTESDRFYGLLADVARTATQRVEHRLRLGDWLAARRPAEAIASWQVIVQDAALAAASRTEVSIDRPAIEWAMRRIAATIDQHGPAVYAEQAALAATARTAALEADDAAYALARVAAAWPFSEAGAAAAREAAVLHAELGDHTGAASVLVSSYTLDPTAEAAGERLGVLLDLLLDQDRAKAAADVAVTIAERHPGITLRRAPGFAPAELPVDAWIEQRAPGRMPAAPVPTTPIDVEDAGTESDAGADARDDADTGADANTGPDTDLAGDDAPDDPSTDSAPPTETAAPATPAPAATTAPVPAPVVRDPRLSGPAQFITGSLLRPTRDGVPVPPRGFPQHPALIADDGAGTISRLDPATLQRAWSVEVIADEVQLLDANDERILLWTGDDPGPRGMRRHPAVLALDPETGDELWRTPPIDEFMPAPLAGNSPSRTTMPNGQPFDPRETIVRLRGDMLYMIRRTGSIAGFDARAGDLPLWVTDTELEELHTVAGDAMVMIASGVRRRVGVPTSEIVVVDPLTGALMRRIEPIPGDGPRWLSTDGLGAVIAGSDEGIEMIGGLSGRRRWSNTADYAAISTTKALRRGDRLVLTDVVGAHRTLDIQTGTVGEAFSRRIEGDWDAGGSTTLLGYDRDLLAVFANRVVRYTPDGAIVAADAIRDDRVYQSVAVAPDGTIFILSRARREPLEGRGEVGSRHWFRVYTVRPDGRLAEDPLETEPVRRVFERIQTIPGWLLMSTRQETIAVPLVAAPTEG